MLLLCQEFNMVESIRLWDTLLSDPDRFNFTNFTCVAMVSFVRDDIIDGDFACCMENLQKSSTKIKDVRDLLDKANDVCMVYADHESSSGNDQVTKTYFNLMR